ncbi:DUF2254 domain-containing protein [Alteromonas lipotrueiana]|uniref:DUF2254 domain-containing protein n=1 Tax=Alteromonas lipotrueiana TaxID=2803815 RepID=UPI001C494C75|nr:DUF2254 domain-containing protein [Alteromonas lipotrueiana]
MKIRSYQRILGTRFGTWWEGVSTSYWFIPVCMMLMSFCFYWISVASISFTGIEHTVNNFLPSVSRDGAHQILTTIASAIITATSIAFSMTIVALTMASSQFGPRLLRTFMYDRGTQFVLGLLVSTFLYCLFALYKVSGATPQPSTLSLLSGLAVVLATINTFAIIYFIHHIARFIQADEIIYRCYRDCINDIETHLPQQRDNEEVAAISGQLIKDSVYQIKLHFMEPGYVQTINATELLQADVEGLEGIDVHVRPGDYVLPDTTVITIHSRYNHPAEQLHTLLAFIVLGSRRTPVQDPEFTIGQLVELAVRALSPGINDPISAISCLDKLTACCLTMSKRDFPADCIVHKQNEVWLKRRTFSLQSVIEMAFNQIRQAGRTHVAVGLHILNCLKQLNAHLPDHAKLLAIQQAHATYELVMSTSQCQADKDDLEIAFTPFRN